MRPHAFLGTLFQFFIVLKLSQLNINLLNVGLGLSTLFLTHIYGMGLNQIYDLKIDRINKSYLPLANREISLRQAYFVILCSAFLSLFVSLLVSPYLLALNLVSIVILHLYSAPPFRLKNHWLGALLSIALTRSIVGCLGLSLFFSDKLFIKTELLFFVIFSFLYSSLIAIAKDIPDLIGDQQYGINSLIQKLGKSSCINCCRALSISSFSILVIESLFWGQLTSAYWSIPMSLALIALSGAVFNELMGKSVGLEKSYHKLCNICNIQQHSAVYNIATMFHRISL